MTLSYNYLQASETDKGERSCDKAWVIPRSGLFSDKFRKEWERREGNIIVFFKTLTPLWSIFLEDGKVASPQLDLLPWLHQESSNQVNTQLTLQLPVHTSSLKTYRACAVLCWRALGSFLFWKTRIFSWLLVSHNILQVLPRTYFDQQMGDICWLLLLLLHVLKTQA